MRSIPAVAVIAVALALTACGSDDSDTSPSAPPSTSTSVAESSAAPNSETALRARLADFYKTVPQGHDWDKAFDYQSPRCQQQTTRGALATMIEEAYGANSGRDFSGDPTYLITMNGDTATVVSKSYDNKGTMAPQTWTFINGKWNLDNC
ncbi:hypothetical protein L5G28_07450 [Gordonia sp. HY285]|uniref:hypothetical protein n=1 Tax=Gordonia liuliyuniae TaxID=2911517 RepID=UPI001F253D85|nr:hypothetical protein [Gordonia liuliyuniae]MCF8609995.1 hypothetical protein [Gordonia liuliyuniae]